MSKVQVLHMQKRVKIPGGLNRHITRFHWVDGKLTVWTPDNADPELTKNNVELVSREITNSEGEKRTLSLQQAVDKRIKDAGIRPRRGQSRCLEIIFSGSNEVMCGMTREEILNWSKDTLVWAQNVWGKENVVSASLHLDERTPHIHMVVVPIVQGESRRSVKQKELDEERGIKRKSYKINHNRLRLSCNEVFTTPLLYTYHDRYAEEVSKKYGLERGVRAEPGSKKKHQSSEDYNRQLAVEAAEKESLIATIQKDYNSKRAQISELEKQSSSLSGEISKNTSKLTNLKNKVQEQQGQMNENKDIISEQNTAISDNNTTINEQTATINSNKKTIKDQEKRISVRKEIDEDALDKRISEKVIKARELEEEIKKYKRELYDTQDELKVYQARVNQLLAGLGDMITLENVPKKKGLLEKYNTSDVDKFIENICSAVSSLNQMNRDKITIDVNEGLREEVKGLRKSDNFLCRLMNSPDLLKQRLQILEQSKIQDSIKNSIEYITQKKVKILKFSEENTAYGKEIYAEFVFEGDQTINKGLITPGGRLNYTTDECVNSYQTAKEHIKDDIWKKYKSIDELRYMRHFRDMLSNYSNRLSSKFGKKIELNSFEESNGVKYFTSSNGMSYKVDKNDIVWTTADKRIKTAKDCIKYLNDNIWNKEGDINTIKPSNMIKLKL